jgi:hypothetical protein
LVGWLVARLTAAIQQTAGRGEAEEIGQKMRTGLPDTIYFFNFLKNPVVFSNAYKETEKEV